MYAGLSVAALTFGTISEPVYADEVGVSYWVPGRLGSVANRPSGWNTWLTFSISPMAPTSTVAPNRRIATK